MLLLAACDSLAPVPPTLTPTRDLSGPTLEPSATVINYFPTEAPAEAIQHGQSIPEAAGVPFGSQIRPIELTPSAEQLRQGITPVEITMADGRVITADLYENLPVQLEQGPILQRLPAVILAASPKTVWGELPIQVRDAGFTVLVADFGTGATSEDLSLALLSLSEADSVNPGLMAVVGLEDGADLALIGCAVDLLCDTVVLISARSEGTLLNLMADYNPRPLMVIASQDDGAAYTTALGLRAVAEGDFSLQEYAGSARGFELVQTQSDIATLIIEWLRRELAPL